MMICDERLADDSLNCLIAIQATNTCMTGLMNITLCRYVFCEVVAV